MKVAWSPTGSRGYQMSHVAVDREDLYVSAYAGVETFDLAIGRSRLRLRLSRAAWYMYYMEVRGRVQESRTIPTIKA